MFIGLVAWRQKLKSVRNNFVSHKDIFGRDRVKHLTQFHIESSFLIKPGLTYCNDKVDK